MIQDKYNCSKDQQYFLLLETGANRWADIVHSRQDHITTSQAYRLLLNCKQWLCTRMCREHWGCQASSYEAESWVTYVKHVSYQKRRLWPRNSSKLPPRRNVEAIPDDLQWHSLFIRLYRRYLCLILLSRHLLSLVCFPLTSCPAPYLIRSHHLKITRTMFLQSRRIECCMEWFWLLPLGKNAHSMQCA